MVVDLFRERKWDLVGLRNIWFAISLLIILPGAYFLVIRGLNYGIDFTGGGLITYKLEQPVPANQEIETLERATKAIEATGIEARVQLAGSTGAGADQMLVRTRITKEAGKSEGQVLSEQQEKMLAALTTAIPGINQIAAEQVTAVVSKELVQNAIWSVALGCIFILAWVRIRYFSFQWAFSAVVALVHDVLVLLGVFAMTRREVNSPFVAAALTVIGYSVHDTIIIYDRIRENLRLRKGSTFAETTNISLLETMARSVNTVLTVELVLVAVYLFGGVTLRDFTFAMIVGITTGAYSSIFNASQLLVVFKNREERALAARRALTGRPARPSPTPRRTEPRPVTTPSSRPAAARPPIPVQRTEGEAGETAPAETTTERAVTLAERTTRKKLKATRKRKKRF